MKLLILDGNSVINRAFYGVRPLTTREGLYTHAIYGFLNILEKMEKEEQPEAVCVAFDLHGPTFRHLQYDGYKATRHGMPEELAMQMPVMKDVLRAMNIPIYECQGWEADDVIGTVGRICSNNEWECVIVTGDRDSLQLIDENVHVKLVISKPGQTTATLYDEAKFREEYGFEPRKMVDLKALMGDSSDNIPGVAGVGPKTATDLLLKFGSLDGVYANLDDPSVKPKLREKLENGKDNAYLSYDLATIRCEAPIDFEPRDAIVQPYNRPALYELFQKLEFVRLIDKYGLRGAELEAPKPEKKSAVSLPRVDSLPEKAETCAVYFAPDGSLGVAWEAGVCALTPMEVQMGGALPSGKLICHDSKTAMHALCEAGLCFDEAVFDTALAAYDLNPSQSDYPVSKLATNFLGVTVDDGDAAACAEAVWNLCPVLREELKKQGMERLYFDIELPLCSVLYRMEKEGIAIDRLQLQQFGDMLSQRIDDCEKLIYSYSEEPFNINSTKQLGELLFEKLGLPPVKKTKTGYSTDVKVLEELEGKHPLIGTILEHRKLAKLQSTYIDGLKPLKNAVTGRIHTRFQQTVTVTGRLSSTDPNMQNIPTRTEEGKQIRKVFVPGEGYDYLMSCDYSQVELRILACIAKDEVMLEAFKNGQDVHARTAAEVFGVPLEEVTSQMRSRAKAVNFGIVYGISDFGLAAQIKVSRKEAAGYIESYFERYTGVKKYMDDMIELARKQGYVSTLLGRRRYLPEINHTNFNLRSFAERTAINTPIQGTAADIMKNAMVKVAEALQEAGLKSRILLQVHDELVLEVPEAEKEIAAKVVKEAMESAATMDIPLLAEVSFGKNWAETK